MDHAAPMTVENAVRVLRSRPECAELVRDAYLGTDVVESARRFEASGEFAEVCRILESFLPAAAVLDIGAGVGIASYAFVRAGARAVYALEPDESHEIGRGAIRRLTVVVPVCILAGVAEAIPLGSETVDIVYARQVLHHTRDLR